MFGKFLRHHALFLGLLGVGLFLGCSQVKQHRLYVQETHQRTEEIRLKASDIEAEVKKLSLAIDELVLKLGGVNSSMKADLTMSIKQLEGQLQTLLAEMDESQHRFKLLEQKMDALMRQRLLVKSVHTQGDSAVQGDTSNRVTETTQIVQGLDIEKIYNQAREDYVVGKYDIAFEGFKTVFEKDTEGSFKDNAAYWMGECHYKKQQYVQAIEIYGKCINDFPGGNKACSARFKLGLSYEQLGQKDKRNEVWKGLIEKCPATNEAERAKDLLKN